MATPQQGRSRSARRWITLEALEKLATMIGVCLGIVAFAWQVSDAIRDRREQVMVQAGGNFGLAPNDPVDIFERKRLWVDVTNVGRRAVFVREVRVAIQNTDEDGPFQSSLLAFNPDSGASEIEPGSFKRFTTPWRSGRDGRAMEDGGYSIRVITTKKTYERSGQSRDLDWNVRGFYTTVEP